MYMMLFPLLYLRIALDMMGLSWIMETWPGLSRQSDKDD